MRIAVLNWRDSTHPEGGGAERYAEQVSTGLVRRGHEVTFYCADHGGAPTTETVHGVTVRRQGGRKSVYAASARALRRDERCDGAFDVVVDVQNGLPFFTPLVTSTPVVNLVHHVHREQWPVVFGPVVARVGWSIESRVAPRVYRGHQYVAVSGRTRDELAGLGIDPGHVAVIHNGTDEPLALDVPRSEQPTIVVLGRLVPHKRVEQAVDVATRLRASHPGLRLRVVGEGWWRERIAAHAQQAGVADMVDLLGFVPEQVKHAELAAAWVALAPSVKEGWGLSVVEAASHGVPTVAYRGAGGLSESILDGRTGILVGDRDEMTQEVARLLADGPLRERLGSHAREHARQFTWSGTVTAWESLLMGVAHGQAPVAGTDADSLTLESWLSRRRG